MKVTTYVCPPLSKELIDYLEATVPERCPSLNMSEREIWLYAGKRELVRGLVEQFKAQQENILEVPSRVHAFSEDA